MYRYFFGINDFPFGACPDPRFLYMMPQIQEAWPACNTASRRAKALSS